ncbi:recombinase family protein [uncultured Oscillibacter sp.]|uniref:recombinase family protein n=1 Tax=uncultured Oscillibacter sp. TaxID=876091 RepID=UPI0028060652|nr:recombinase family protein [uncultured Oscillibacter sp.]
MLGIEIWSAREGQQRFESHADKLINYIRYWQASGESLKISERTKTRMQQLTSEGFYCGGRAPYGYRLVKTGRVNPRGRDVHDLQIIPGEAEVIRIVFDYYIRYGYGGRRIATELAAQGIYDRNGEVFHPSSINAFLHRELFTGVMCRGGGRSQLNPELQIISPDTFQKAQQVMEKRKQGQLPKKLVGKALLSGNVYCGCCGGRVFASTVRRTHRVTEQNERIPVYKCYNRVQHRERCSTQSTYRAERIDKEVLRQLKCHVDTHPELQKLYDKAMEAEFSIRKMILCQWIERVNIFTYDHIEVLFQNEIENF